VLLSRDILPETFCTNIIRLYILNIFEYFCRNIFFTTNFINQFIRIWKLSVFVVLTKVVFSIYLRSKHEIFPTGHKNVAYDETTVASRCRCSKYLEEQNGVSRLNINLLPYSKY